LSPAELPRLTAAGMLAATALVIAAWLGGAAIAAGPLAIVALMAVVTPLALGLRGLMRGRLRTARWLSLVLPFYGAGFLVAAVGNAEARGWITAGAFCVALGFAAVLSWVRRSGSSAPHRPPT
jgi:uncharacterized membrane protein